jgi:lipopolysaccharide/colanic/teichoic acid biosynthesis glycosyltransferase
MPYDSELFNQTLTLTCFMEFTTVPKPNKKYKYPKYQIQTINKRKADIDLEYYGIYYLGKNRASYEKLLRFFGSGNMADGIDQVKSDLFNATNLYKKVVPEGIVCESHLTVKEIQDLYNFINFHPLLYSIPLILDGTNLSEREWRELKKAKWFDEIIVLQETTDQHLQTTCRFLRKVKSNHAEANTDPYVQNSPPEMLYFTRFIKRLFEITLSILAIILLSPLLILISIAIKADSKGPVFYISKRAGKGYQIFNFIKFRTMQWGADKNIDEYSEMNQYKVKSLSGPYFVKISNDPRITKIGKFLRKTSLDELPQMLNVLAGDMSLVGNRPLPLYEAATLTTNEFAVRFMAPAGITGLWQIKKRGKSTMTAEERIRLDIDYAHNANFMYDLWIMANTPSALFQKENA